MAKIPGGPDLHTGHDHVEDRTFAELRESAYRRGFEQGVHAALRATGDMDSSGSLTGRRFRDWLRQLGDWRMREGRFGGPRDRLEWPPLPVTGTA